MPAYGSVIFGIFMPREFNAIAAAEALRVDVAPGKVSKFSAIVKAVMTKFVGLGERLDKTHVRR